MCLNKRSINTKYILQILQEYLKFQTIIPANSTMWAFGDIVDGVPPLRVLFKGI